MSDKSLLTQITSSTFYFFPFLAYLSYLNFIPNFYNVVFSSQLLP